ncbi:MAG: CPBP family intramembrane metalloprotease, partial [Oscillospiraceae bacterium]|nr:CPBP family intramembrane metalloprotease [Oscillospiraceae bacterium]
MSRNKALVLYLLGTLGQIWITCLIVFVLREKGITVNATTFVGMTAIAVGGVSSALWGTIIAVKYK